MPGYQNVMELLVEQMYSSVVSILDCCACPLCKADIIAYALNQLPPKYVTLREGEAYPSYSFCRRSTVPGLLRLWFMRRQWYGKIPGMARKIMLPPENKPVKEELQLLFFI